MIKPQRILPLIAAVGIALFPIAANAHDMSETHEADSANPPRIELAVSADPKAGYNVRIITENFTWAPEHASLEHVEREGHAHIYLADVKLGRVYGEWYHINPADFHIAAGDQELVVTLNGNDHGAYTLNGEPIQASTTIRVVEPSEAHAGHAVDGESAMDSGVPVELVVVAGVVVLALAGAVATVLVRRRSSQRSSVS